MGHLREYTAAVQRQGRGEFVKAHPHAFLMLELSPQDQGTDDWTFHTRTLVRSELTGPGPLTSEAERYRIFEVVKSARNPWPERISVGRARNNDVVLADSSISKLHAHFMRVADGTLVIVDANSRNGTWLNDVALQPQIRTPIRISDMLKLGALVLTLMDGEALYELVHRVLRK